MLHRRLRVRVVLDAIAAAGLGCGCRIPNPCHGLSLVLQQDVALHGCRKGGLLFLLVIVQVGQQGVNIVVDLLLTRHTRTAGRRETLQPYLAPACAAVAMKSDTVSGCRGWTISGSTTVVASSGSATTWGALPPVAICQGSSTSFTAFARAGESLISFAPCCTALLKLVSHCPLLMLWIVDAMALWCSSMQ